MATNTLTAELDRVIQELSSPVSAHEAEEGWTPQAKAGIANYFKNQRDRLAANHKSGEIGLVRGLDAWGVSGGELYDATLRVNRGLLSQLARGD